jgi:hypothetical protein
MKKFMYLVVCLAMVGCGPGFQVKNYNPPPNNPAPEPEPAVMFPVASAVINVTSYGDLAALAKKKKTSIASLLIPQAHADIAQGSATVNVTYNNPGVSTFTINTASFGNAITVSGNDLNLGTISLASLDDNSLRVCTGVGAPANKCNRLYIRVFTLGTATGGITGVAGFINKSVVASPYGIDVLAGAITTPIGFNASPTAASVTDAATVYTYTIPGNMNRVRLTNITNTPFPIKADLSNAGSGAYEMNLVVQYALGYVP